MLQSLSYVSPKAVLKALNPLQGQLPPPTSLETSSSSTTRVEAFKRFISDMERRGGGEIVPPFPPGADWFNAPPLQWGRELQGKIVILDFWTYCCINCMHILPDLAYLESKFSTQPAFSVVGVHSAKFENEKESSAIRDAILRYDIRHPVVNDRQMVLWRDLGVSSWPTLAVISPTGRLIVSLTGEGHRQDLEDIVTAALEYYGEQGVLDNTPVPVALEKDKDARLATSPLRFPGKLALDELNSRLFISDSGNHRVLVVDSISGQYIAQYGGNGPGLVADTTGTTQSAKFNRPQGIAYSPKRDALFVCDTENHALREINLKTGAVSTVVGDGVKAEGDYRGGRSGPSQRLNSPWDVVVADDDAGTLFIAMAGQHQIWGVDLPTKTAAAVSGTGAERNQNGPTGLTTAWAQPSGLALVSSTTNSTVSLVVADSESSAVRLLNLSTGGSTLCVGGDPLFSDNLFKFGDKDGLGSSALLQHPPAVASSFSSSSSSQSGTNTTPNPTTVWVADSYNHRLKRLNLETCSIQSVAGTGTAGFQDGSGPQGQFSEPGGLAVDSTNTKVYVCDTNNSLIRVYDTRTNKVSTLGLKGVPPPTVSPDAVAVSYGSAPSRGTVPVVRLPFKIPSCGTVRIALQLPDGYHLTPGANSRYEARIDTGQAKVVKGPLVERGNAATAVLDYAFDSGDTATTKTGPLSILATVYFCQDKSVCLFQEVVFEADIDVDMSGSSSTGRTEEFMFQLSAQAPQTTTTF